MTSSLAITSDLAFEIQRLQLENDLIRQQAHLLARRHSKCTCTFSDIERQIYNADGNLPSQQQLIRENKALQSDKQHLEFRLQETEAQIVRLSSELRDLRSFLLSGIRPVLSEAEESVYVTTPSVRRPTMGDAETEHLLLAAKRLQTITKVYHDPTISRPLHRLTERKSATGTKYKAPREDTQGPNHQKQALSAAFTSAPIDIDNDSDTEWEEDEDDHQVPTSIHTKSALDVLADEAFTASQERTSTKQIEGRINSSSHYAMDFDTQSIVDGIIEPFNPYADTPMVLGDPFCFDSTYPLYTNYSNLLDHSFHNDQFSPSINSYTESPAPSAFSNMSPAPFGQYTSPQIMTPPTDYDIPLAFSSQLVPMAGPSTVLSNPNGVLMTAPKAAKKARASYSRWTLEEDRLLLEAISVHGLKWEVVPNFVPNRTYHQCRQRFLRGMQSGENLPSSLASYYSQVRAAVRISEAEKEEQKAKPKRKKKVQAAAVDEPVEGI